VKHSRLLFGFMTVLGIVSLTMVLASTYLNYVDAVCILASLPPSQLGIWFALGCGIVFLTVGILGIGRQYLKNSKDPFTRRRAGSFTVLALILVPSLAFATMFVASGLIIVYAPMFPLRSEVTHVSVISTSPLILSVDVRAITSRDSPIEGANIMDSDDDRLVAHCSVRPFCELPAGSTRTLTLNFSYTYPSGNYIVRLVAWDYNHGSSPFTIP
jgi:hypothetical protein